jgi:DeoR/GlpR family transcriptional regulator of sugar metabolism
MSNKLTEGRRLEIVRIIQEKEKVSISELSREVGMSEITIRRDLLDLSARGMIHRVYGGAIIAKLNLIDPPVLQRIQNEKELKESIGFAAAALIKEGESVFIGSGSTTAYVARNLVNRKRLTIITNALNVGMEFSDSGGITVVVIGGMMRPSELSLIGHIADQALKEVRVDKVIMGITAISVSAGLSNDYLPEVMTDRAILNMAPEVILVADHTKFGKVASGYVAPLNRISTLITDHDTNLGYLDKIRNMGINVIVTREDCNNGDETFSKELQTATYT